MMEASDINDLLSVSSIKMETCENTFGVSEDPDSTDPLSIIPQYVTESDLGLIQSGSEILPTNVFSDSPEDEDDTVQISESTDTQEVIVQLMDIRTRLSQLLSMLEQKLGADLSGYTFWLQDTKMLESHRTLVEQCIKGEGMVQVNIQIKPAEKKINIMDVLKPDEELIQWPEQADNSCKMKVVDVNEVSMETPSLGEQVTTIPDAASVKWVVDEKFRNDHRRVRIPDDPADWSVQHVKLWIQWAVRQFNLTGIKLCDWNITGAELCALSNNEFKQKVPSDPGHLFWTHFEMLRKCKFIVVIQKNAQDVLDVPRSAIKKKAKQYILHDCKEEYVPQCLVTRLGYNGQIHLWQFLLELLTSAEFYDVIRWHGSEGEFILIEPETVACLWGARKNKPTMNYEKLSRALRYYYEGDMISKVTGKRFVYKFVCDLRQLLGYSADELAALVKEVHESNDESEGKS